ncbi:hypothetical protein DERP_001105 [Dermatophagoides pteronyssinus]|uniref:Uncharacterized protein n=1 Tax=Dermatophagoides pteronyssinus TaxID=6956 RepID=A0ABQ8JDJ7_DERPT|nr:hypothetical protein DERP_001105 [Dermatophagoides pteronyssinus]
MDRGVKVHVQVVIFFCPHCMRTEAWSISYKMRSTFIYLVDVEDDDSLKVQPVAHVEHYRYQQKYS